MDNYFNNSAYSQKPDQIFASGLAQIVESLISKYMDESRLKQQESDKQNQSMQKTLETLSSLMEDQIKQQAEIQNQHIQKIQNDIQTVLTQYTQQTEVQNQHAQDIQNGIQSVLMQYTQQTEVQNQHAQQLQDSIQTVLAQYTQQTEVQNQHTQDIQNSIQSALIQTDSQNQEQADNWNKKALELQVSISNISDAMQTIQTALSCQADEQARYKAKQDMLETQIAQLKQEAAEYHELDDEWYLFRQFQSWKPSKQLHLPVPKRDSFMDFILSNTYKDTIKYLYQSIDENIWELSEQDIEMFDRLIDFWIHLQNQIYGKRIYNRMNAEKGENFSLSLHQSHLDGPAVGTIDHVLLRGVTENSRTIFRSYVRIKES